MMTLKSYSIRLFYTFLLTISSLTVFGQLIWIDDFEGGPTYTNISSPLCNDMSVSEFGYWGIVCADGGGCGNEIGPAITPNYNFSNPSNNFLGALNTDHQGATTSCGSDVESIEWGGINISACAGPLYFCVDLAKSTNVFDPNEFPVPGIGGWDDNSTVLFLTFVDGASPPNVLGELEADCSGSSNGKNCQPIGIDTDCDGVLNGVITNDFTTFCFQMTTGTTADVRINIAGLNEGNEDIAIDNVAIYCGTPPGTFYISDFDCDGVASYQDCNDFDASVTSVVTPCNTDPCLGDIEMVDPNDICNCIVITPQVLGCTNPLSSNYNPLAICDDGSCDCPPTLLLNGMIPTGLYEASNYIISDGQVISTSNGPVIFHGGNYIDLIPGFEADATYPFTAEIYNCQ